MSQLGSSGGPTIQQTEVVILVLPIVAILVTIFRLAKRLHQRRLWFDDGWAAFAMIVNVVFFVVSFVSLQNYAEYSQATNIVLYYVIDQLFCTAVWASRISILFTVVRLTSPLSVLRKMLLVVFVIFLITWMILFAQVIWVCEAEPGWKSQPRPQCDLGASVAIAQIITDVLGDTVLIIVPFRLVYRVKLNRIQKIRILSIFSASAITTVVCVTHSYYVLIHGELKEAVAAFVEASVALIVANLSVVVAFLLRISTDETTSFSSEELQSVITFGPIWVSRRPTTVIGIETTTIILDEFTTDSEASTQSRKDTDVEACAPTGQPSVFSDARRGSPVP